MMYGKKVQGVIRSTFLIDPDGRLTHIWSPVKVAGHVAAVLEALQARP
jgi:peroxiredoxin Q/BCP